MNKIYWSLDKALAYVASALSHKKEEATKQAIKRLQPGSMRKRFQEILAGK